MSDEPKRRAPRGPYAKTVRVQEQILQAATDVFAEVGFRGASMARVAERAGVSERGIAHHFATKEVLLKAVLSRHQRRSAGVVEAASGLGSLHEMLRVIEEDDRDASVFVELRSVLAAEAVAQDHPAHTDFTANYAGVRAYLTAAFVLLREQGKVVGEMSAGALAAGVVALMDGLQLQWLYDREAFDLLGVIHGYLAGVLTPEAMEELLAMRVAD